MDRRKRRWTFTNPENRETYRFERNDEGTIKTVKFLGWKTPRGRIIPPRRKPRGLARKLTSGY